MSSLPTPTAGSRRAGPASAALVTLVAVVLALAALRLVTLLLALGEHGGAPGLHVDEAQYWQWSRALDWGYYSKPPVIAVLLAMATAAFGDGVLAVKSVALVLYPITALVLGLLAMRLVRDAGQDGLASRAGVIAATLFMASPLAALLGLATTTDAPLLLCWSLASLLLWQARQAVRHDDHAHRARALWLALGLVCGIGLLSKYSYAAWIIGALAWVRLDRLDRSEHRAEQLRGLLSAAGVAVAMVLPHLAWNAAMGWPTLQHTAEITAVPHGHAADAGIGLALLSALWRSLSVPLGALVMAGPLLVLLLPGLLPKVDRSPRARLSEPLRYLSVLHLPLLLLGMAQALRGEPQINWVAPLVPGIVTALALALAMGLSEGSSVGLTTPQGLPTRPRRRWQQAGLVTLVALHLGIGAALPLAHTLSQWWRTAVDPQAATLPRRLDIWARMRGWPEAFADLRPALLSALQDRQDTPLLTASRSVIAIGAHAWRDLPLHWRAWADGGPPRTHHQMVAGWSGQQAHTGTVLVLADADLPPGLLAYLEEPERLATGAGQAADHSRVTLTLWRAHVRDAAGHVAIAPLTLPTPPTPPARSARSARPAPPTPSARPPRSAP